MRGAGESGFVIAVANRGEVPTDDLELGAHVLLDVVDGHLKHAEVHVCYWGEGTAGDEDEGRFGGVPERVETVGGEVVR